MDLAADCGVNPQTVYNVLRHKIWVSLRSSVPAAAWKGRAPLRAARRRRLPAMRPVEIGERD